MKNKVNDVLGTVNRGDVCESGLCTLCRADCTGKCETFKASLIGRELLYPRDFGMVTAGSGHVKTNGVSYETLRIQGYGYGSEGLAPSLEHNADNALFTRVNLETNFGNKCVTQCKIPLMTGALGSTFIAAKYWKSLAIGAALTGIPIVIGENVVGVDRDAVLEKGRIIKAPELERRIEQYMNYYNGFGAIIVQLNVEDTRNGVAEYLIEKYGNQIIIELKWGQGAKDIGGEIQVESLEYARFLKNRGYVIDPDPYLPEVEEAFEKGSIKTFARHSRLGYAELDSHEKVRECFMENVVHLRTLGFDKITLKTGAYGMEELAMAIKFASEANLELLTIDGAGGGTGMSPWHMMESWGVPSLHLHAKAYEYASILESYGTEVVDIAFAGGIAREDQMFKALALGAPYTKMICMGRATMIPAFVGSNIEGVLKPRNRDLVNGQWQQLPTWLTKEIGTSVEELFAGYYEVQKLVGEEAMATIPYGAIAFYTMVDKLSAGLQQLLAGARKFDVKKISRNDLVAVNTATAKVTNLPFVTDYKDDIAKRILKA